MEKKNIISVPKSSFPCLLSHYKRGWIFAPSLLHHYQDWILKEFHTAVDTNENQTKMVGKNMIHPTMNVMNVMNVMKITDESDSEEEEEEDVYEDSSYDWIPYAHSVSPFAFPPVDGYLFSTSHSHQSDHQIITDITEITDITSFTVFDLLSDLFMTMNPQKLVFYPCFPSLMDIFLGMDQYLHGRNPRRLVYCPFKKRNKQGTTIPSFGFHDGLYCFQFQPTMFCKFHQKDEKDEKDGNDENDGKEENDTRKVQEMGPVSQIKRWSHCLFHSYLHTMTDSKGSTTVMTPHDFCWWFNLFHRSIGLEGITCEFKDPFRCFL